jgi:hypothetical protein
MTPCIKPICDSIQKLPFNDATLVWAADQPVVVAKHLNANSSAWEAAISKIKDSACVGGQDNAAALQLALTTDCLPASGANIVWLHGPQTIKFGGSKLADIWKAHSANSSLYEYQAVLGPNESIRALDASPSVNVVPHFGGINEDLTSLFTQLDGSRDVFSVTRQFLPNDNSTRVDAPAFLTQLCASDLIRTELSNQAKTHINSALAEAYRIVTPLTSCVVLLDPPTPDQLQAEANAKAAREEAKGQVSVTAQLNKLNYAAQHSAEKKSSFGNNSGSTAMEDSSAKEPAMVEHQQSSALIPTKPEPPLSMLMFCVGLIGMAIMFWRKTLKKKCL